MLKPIGEAEGLRQQLERGRQNSLWIGVPRVASPRGRSSEVPPRDALHSIILSKVSQAQKIKLYISPLTHMGSKM